MKRTQIVGICLILVLMLSAACTPKEAAVPAPKAPASAAAAAPVPAPAPAAPARPAWEVEWDTTVEAAKKEGKVTLITVAGALTRAALSAAFHSTFDMRTEWLAGTSPELSAKVMAERRAGIHSIDVTLVGYSAPSNVLKPAGALRSLEGILFLPELADPQEIQKVWRFGLEWVDKEHMVLAFAGAPNIGIVVNTQLVQPGEIKAYRDLLNPKWKGKIVLLDPTTGAGPGITVLRTLGDYLLNWDFVRQIAEQRPALTSDARLQMTWLAQGKYAIVLGTRPEAAKEFLDLGAPVKILVMEEGEALTPGSNVVAAMKEAPHPNAAKLFLNWLLSKEGQSIYVKAHGVASSRLDVSTEGVNPILIPDRSKKYVTTGTEEWIKGMPEATRKAKEIFGKLR